MKNICRDFGKVCLGIGVGILFCSAKTIYLKQDFGTCVSDVVVSQALEYSHEHNISN